MPAYITGEIASTGPPDQVYSNFSPQQTAASRLFLAALTSDVISLYPSEGVSFLALTPDVEVSGHSAPVHGMVGIKSKLLAYPEVAVFLGVHEAVHARLGGAALRKTIDTAAPQFQEYFRGRLIPAWMDGKIAFGANDDYLRSRYWDDLYPGGWQGPQAVGPDGVQGAVENYFSLIARDNVGDDRGFWHHPGTSFPWRWDEAQAQPIVDPARTFGDRQEWLARLMLTGYQMGENLRHYYRDNNRNFPEVDMWGWEEGFANYIAHGLTGVPLEAVQEVAPQDPGKLALAQRFIDTGIPASVIAPTITGYQDLHQLIQTELQP